MTKEIAIPANEALHIRVFALSLSAAEAKTLTDRLEHALGARGLNPDGVEVFACDALGDMPLSTFLVEGHDAQPDPVMADRGRLDALEGHVMLVHASAFGGEAMTLSPQPALTLIGTYPQQGIDTTSRIDLETPSAQPQPATPEPPAKKRPSDAAMSGRIAMVALLVAFGVVALMLWVGG